MKRPPKKTASKHMQEADAYFSKFIRARDGACVSCGVTDHLQCAHIHSRSYKAIRTNADNAVALCRSCHTRFTHRPIEWRLFIDNYQPGLWDDLADIALRYERVDWKAEAAYWKSQVAFYA
jgi:5-methylcytosine-specific restriction endonuclease McrA